MPMHNITTCLWFDTQAEDASTFYTGLFKGSKIHTVTRYPKAAEEVSGKKAGSVMTVEFEIAGTRFTALNGGPIFTITPAISFFIHCDSAEEVDGFWEKLSDGGTVRMELGEYPYSKRYGWVEDKFGVNWQVMQVKEHMEEKIVPSLLFVDKKFGIAGDAMKLYMSVFPDSTVKFIQKSPAGDPMYKKEGAVMYAAFTLRGQTFTVMDGPGKRGFDFNEAVSFVVHCDTQEEIDTYWKKLSAVKESEQCGWLKDTFGVSWQIVPRMMGEIMNQKDPKKAEKVMAAMLQMKKLDIAGLQKAAEAS